MLTKGLTPNKFIAWMGKAAIFRYQRKVGGIGPTFYPTGRIEEDMQKIRAFYATITGKYHDMFSNAGLRS
jgi:hypothetical protein